MLDQNELESRKKSSNLGKNPKFTKKNVHASQLVSSLSGQFSTQLAAHTKSVLAFNHIGINVLSSNTVMPYL